MRKRDRIKGYLPYLTGGLYFLLINFIVDELSINTHAYGIYLVMLWALATAASIAVLEKGIDLFESRYDNDNEEEDINND
tara:strand:+ start:2836 stop:3075 length:240 start_codon:yes stop_codon:yes gene_type:complete